MSKKQKQNDTPSATDPSEPVCSDSGKCCYTEGVIKELRIQKYVHFSIEPSTGFVMEFTEKGEKKNCAVFKKEDADKDVFNGNATKLVSGDFTFKVPEGLTLDQLLLMKINRCNIRLYVEDENAFTRDSKLGKEIPVQEIRVKQK